MFDDRRLRFHARLVLAWFALYLSAAIASPWIAPWSIERVCSANGAVKLLVTASDGTVDESAARGLDCPMCLTVDAPPPVATVAAVEHQPLGYFTAGIPAARIAALTGAPLPPRGPPALS